MVYTYLKYANLSQLLQEIHGSFISSDIVGVTQLGGDIRIEFNRRLIPQEETMLNSIVEAHKPTVSDDVQPVKLTRQVNDDDIPYVYSTSKPLNHYVCFQGADDLPHDISHTHPPHVSEHLIHDIGMGNKLTFKLNSTTKQISKDFTFNENVYIKDGYIITQNAPFGASIDVEIIHPEYGLLFPFAKQAPILGTGWFPLDTEDRGYLPRGIIVRITVHNSDPCTDDVEEPPATFRLSGRLELYRPKPENT